jgi:predicted CoA-binding protein
MCCARKYLERGKAMSGPDQTIRNVLSQTHTIALVGASSDAVRDSHQVMAFLQTQGYRVIRSIQLCRVRLC